MPNTRMYTSDITLASMETDNGEGFLTLLRKYVPDEATVVEGGSTSYLHPGWTKETIERLENAGRVAGVQIWIALRDSFFVSFLYNTISSVVGIPRAIKSDGNESTPLHWGTRRCFPRRRFHWGSLTGCMLVFIGAEAGTTSKAGPQPGSFLGSEFLVPSTAVNFVFLQRQ
ncbi:hypothetical protein B0H14DRAFT_3638033 [Mycena olivaceomarginata]|nr:hypothetical protein B0H14DRAFT_3638033 [Mycena olivaceomarginata]